MVAFLCNTTCNSCTSFNFCTSCGTQAGIQTFLLQSVGICSYTCAASYYQNGLDFICDICDISCSNCTSTLVGYCTLCNYNQGYVQSYSSSATCLFTCPSGQYKDTVILSCLPCNANCLTCDNNSTNCTTCPFSTSAGQLSLSGSQCVVNCPSKTFLNNTVNVCSDCNVYCSVCWGSTNQECSRCANLTTSGVTIIYYLAVGSSTCSASCPQGQFIDASIPNYCQQCSSLCIYCLNNKNNCVNNTCPLGFFFYNNSCMPVCIQGTFAKKSNGQC